MRMFENQNEEMREAIRTSATKGEAFEKIKKINSRKVLTENYVKTNGVIMRTIPKVRGKKARRIDKINRHNEKFDAIHSSKKVKE